MLLQVVRAGSKYQWRFRKGGWESDGRVSGLAVFWRLCVYPSGVLERGEERGEREEGRGVPWLWVRVGAGWWGGGAEVVGELRWLLWVDDARAGGDVLARDLRGGRE